MNLKALITTLVLGSSSVALAKPVVTFSGSASVSVGSNVTVRDHRPTVVVRDHRHDDGCTSHPALPVVSQPVYHPPQRPIVAEPFYEPANTQISASGSTYLGTFGKGNLSLHRDHAWARPRTWFNLTEATRIDGGREFFNLRQQGGFFQKIALQNLGGRTEIRQVAIEYKTARGIVTQKVRFDQLLAGRTSLTIDLEGDSRTIQRIIVYGDSGRGSAYQLLAM